MERTARRVLVVMACVAAAWPGSLAAATTPEVGRGELAATRALIDAGRYKEAEEAAGALADRLRPQGDSAMTVAQALDLWVEARWRNGKAWHDGTLEAAERAAALKQELVGPESAAVADSLLQQARVLDEWARFGEARERYDRAIALYRRTVSAGDPRLALAHGHLGGMLVELGRLREARPHLTESVRDLEAALGPEHPDLAAVLVHMAWLEKHARNLEEARALFERALGIYEQTLGAEHPLVADPLDGLARLLHEMDEVAAARQAGRRAEAIRIRALGPEHPSLVFTYVQLWWSELGNPAEAERCIARAGAIAEPAYPANHPMLAVALAYRALRRNEDASFAPAWREFERALQIFESIYGPDHWRVATTLANMSWLLDFIGERQRAIELLEQALAKMRRAEVRRFYSGALWMLGNLMEEEGRHQEALRLSEQALAVAEEERPHGLVVAGIYQLRAEALKRLGRWREAEEMYRTTVAVREAYGGADHVHLQDTLREYADLRALMGDFEGAMALNGRVLRILEKAFGRQHYQLKWSLDLEARLTWAAGDLDGAFDVARELEETQRETFVAAIAGLPERQALGLLGEEQWGRDLMLSAVLVAPDPGRELAVADAIVRTRGLVTDRLGRRHRAASLAEDPEIVRLDRVLGVARERLARLVVSGENEGDPEELQRQVAAAEREKERAELELAARSRSFRRDREQAMAGLAEVGAALPRGSALVAYTLYQRYAPPAEGSAPSWPLEPTPSYLALVLRPGDERPRFVALGPAGPIDEGVRSLASQTWSLAESGDRAPRLSLAAFRREGGELRRLIWDPLALHLEGAEKVFVVPDGELNLLPFGALPAGAAEYLAEQLPAIHYLSAERDLVGGGGAAEGTAGQGLLALGDPAFDEQRLFAALSAEDNEVLRLAQRELQGGDAVYRGQRAACGDFASMRFAALPASAAELESIRASWRASVASSDATLLRRAAANEAAFKRRAVGRRVVHLATHGFYLGGSCQSAERTSRVGGLAENPLLLSGLALAGANHRQAAGPEEEDGILTAEEIAALDLQGVEWAVLSGCETGVGEAMAGEGVFGLRRAFQLAGARTVIMSLGPVDDEATREWMEALYRHRFTEELSTLEAVRRASLDLLADRRAAGLSTHPYYWAGFVAAGDWR